MMRNVHQPIRTCVGCRRRRPFREMISLMHGHHGGMGIAALGGVRQRGVTGRPLHCCPNHTCVRKALHVPVGRGKTGTCAVEFESVVKEIETMLTTWRQRRKRGLKRRGLGLKDQHLLAWQAITEELNNSTVVLSQGA